MNRCASLECLDDTASTVAPSHADSLDDLFTDWPCGSSQPSTYPITNNTSVSQKQSLLPVYFIHTVFVPCPWAVTMPQNSSVASTHIQNGTNSQWSSEISTEKQRVARNVRWCAKKQRTFQVHPMPVASEETYQARVSKRQAALDLVERSEEYCRCVASGRQLPPVPDATDSSISKRSWEVELMKFRHAVKTLAKIVGSPAPRANVATKALRPRWADMVDSDDEDE